MKVIGTRLSDIVHHCAHVASVLGAVVGYHLDFANRILIAEEDGWTTHRVVVVILAINLEVVGAGALPVDGKPRTITVAVRHIPSGGNPWREQRETVQVTAYR